MKSPSLFTPAFVFIFAIALGLFGAACKKKPAATETDTPKGLPGVVVLDAKQAAASFTQNVESQLDILDLAKRADSALVKKAEGNQPEQIVYIFRGVGHEASLEPIAVKLGNKWPEVPPEEVWLPWKEILVEEHSRAGATMGFFQSDDFIIGLWVDVYATDLFVTYKKRTPRPSSIDEE